MVLDYLGGSMDDKRPDDRQKEILLRKRKCWTLETEIGAKRPSAKDN